MRFGTIETLRDYELSVLLATPCSAVEMVDGLENQEATQYYDVAQVLCMSEGFPVDAWIKIYAVK